MHRVVRQKHKLNQERWYFWHGLYIFSNKSQTFVGIFCSVHETELDVVRKQLCSIIFDPFHFLF